ncbi:alanine/glycine:cation symporter family protein [Arenicella xantha]|uniref:AGCS family alanine or glycine:cation symporter n=1 Tax=Arenicella xantha TaxID=644221 RepID=A0A395JP27_9GAMM|nr:alanine/glycine:cation symporter family protein [Arenicella xantha]RBP53359.1 AGCS family alanine or glycine:cation symporter [Arenicella xantha]
MLNQIIALVNDVLWGQWQVLIVLLVLAGLWFSISLGAIQIRHFGHMFALIRNSTGSDKDGISSFQALCTSLSARVGTGNLAGVALAISVGGAGAVFWMWVIALLGMATGFAESLLAQVYKVRDSHKEFRGGPAYYIEMGLGKRWLAVLFSICLFLGYGLFFSAMQANTIADALNNAYGVNTLYSGIVITAVAGAIVIGGLRTIARFAELVVPVMGVLYVITALGVTLMNISLVPEMLGNIISSAFGLQEAGAGALGAAIKAGIQRGLYSNEAGSGSAPHAAAGASPNPNHPATQGFIQMLGVFFDTIILCTCTAVIILLAGDIPSGNMTGIRLTQEAMTHHIGGYGLHFVSLAITLFAFTSVVANYAYAQSNLRVFRLDNKFGNAGYTVAYLSMVLWGSGATLKEVWAAADMALGLMTVVNVTALVLLTPTIVAVSRDYFSQHAQGLKPTFDKTKCPVQGDTEPGIWN